MEIVLSVLCAIISVGTGLIPYWSVYKIITIFIGETAVISEICKWCAVAISAYAARFLFYGISTSLSHISAYKILESIRLKIADKLMRAPLGTVLSEPVGKLKSILIDSNFSFFKILM